MTITPRKVMWWLPIICLVGAVVCGAVTVVGYMQYGYIPFVERGRMAMDCCIIMSVFLAMIAAAVEGSNGRPL